PISSKLKNVKKLMLVVRFVSNPSTFSKLQPFSDPIPKANEDCYMSFNEIYSNTSSTSVTTNNLGINGMETIDYTCGTTFYGILDLSEPSSPTFLSNNNCNITESAKDLQDVENGINDDDDSDINDTEDYDDKLLTEQNVNSGPSIKALFSLVFVNAKLTCSTPMEVPYFSSRLYPD
ncbi:18525_t:CDS:2, partial [Gigaspora rosea]